MPAAQRLTSASFLAPSGRKPPTPPPTGISCTSHWPASLLRLHASTPILPFPCSQQACCVAWACWLAGLPALPALPAHPIQFIRVQRLRLFASILATRKLTSLHDLFSLSIWGPTSPTTKYTLAAHHPFSTVTTKLETHLSESNRRYES